jgi:Flp pilus assembly pilin Flp
MFGRIADFIRDETGDAVTWIVIIIVSVIITVVAWKYLGGGVANASKAMGNALSGE